MYVEDEKTGKKNFTLRDQIKRAGECREVLELRTGRGATNMMSNTRANKSATGTLPVTQTSPHRPSTPN